MAPSVALFLTTDFDVARDFMAQCLATWRGVGFRRRFVWCVGWLFLVDIRFHIRLACALVGIVESGFRLLVRYGRFLIVDSGLRLHCEFGSALE